MLDPSLFVTDAPIAATLTLPDGNVYTLHFRQLSAVKWRSIFLKSQDGEDRNPALIAACLCNEDGSPGITVDEAARLTADAELVIVTEILRINGRGGKGKS